jgi:hypothetical protein
VARDGSVFVAWRHADAGLQVARWAGAAWETLGGPLETGGGEALEPWLHLDESSRPWLAWIGGTRSQPRLRVARWSGAKWERLHDQAPTAGPGLGSPVLESAGASWRVLSWVELAGPGAPTESRLGVARWAGDRFDPAVGPPAHRRGQGAAAPLLALGARRLDGAGLDGARRQAGREGPRLAPARGEWSPALTGLHADPHPANAQDASLAPVLGGFLVLWDEPGGKLARLRLAHVSSCPGGAPKAKAGAATAQPAGPGEGWPRTVEEAADRFLAALEAGAKEQLRKLKKAELARFHHGRGSDLRSDLGLFKGNAELLEACGGGAAEECSMKVVERAWEKLQGKKHER